MTDKEKLIAIRTEVERRARILYGTHAGRSSDVLPVLEELLSYIDFLQKEPVSKVWHDPDEEPEVERTIIWEDEKMMGKHLFQGQWRPKIDVFGRKERWCYLSDILNL